MIANKWGGFRSDRRRNGHIRFSFQTYEIIRWWNLICGQRASSFSVVSAAGLPEGITIQYQRRLIT